MMFSLCYVVLHVVSLITGLVVVLIVLEGLDGAGALLR